MFYERELPGPETKHFSTPRVSWSSRSTSGYAELVDEGERARRFNTSVLVERDGSIAGKYRKVHLPGHAEHEPWRAFQHLEKAYFEPGDLGFPVFDAMGGKLGMCICNDRRWPETFRVMGLKGVEMVLLGYNNTRAQPTRPAA